MYTDVRAGEMKAVAVHTIFHLEVVFFSSFFFYI